MFTQTIHSTADVCQFNNASAKCLCCRRLSVTKSRMRANSVPSPPDFVSRDRNFGRSSFSGDAGPALRKNPSHSIMPLPPRQHLESRSYHRHPSYLPGHKHKHRGDKPSLLHDHPSLLLLAQSPLIFHEAGGIE